MIRYEDIDRALFCPDLFETEFESYVNEIRLAKDKLIKDAFKAFALEWEWVLANSNRIEVKKFIGANVEEYWLDGDSYLGLLQKRPRILFKLALSFKEVYFNERT